MDNDEKLTRVYEHGLYRSRDERDRLFQRVDFFLLSTSFLVVGFVAAVASHVAELSVMIAVVGMGISGLFWGMNSWNEWRLRQIDREIGSEVDRLREDNFRLDEAIVNLRNKCDSYARLRWEVAWRTLGDALNPYPPAWHTRLIPFSFVLIWLCLCVALGLGVKLWFAALLTGIPFGVFLKVGINRGRQWSRAQNQTESQQSMGDR